MASDLHGEMLVQRVTREHRRAIVPLAIALLVNVIVYGVVVYPLSQRVANIEQRDRTAEAQLLAAQREHAQAVGTLTGKDRAADGARDVLQGRPAVGSRRREAADTPASRAAGAESNLKFLRATFVPVLERNRTLTQLKIEMSLSGSYRDMRRVHSRA